MKKETKSILIKGVPLDIVEKLEKQAENNLRSVTKEVINLIQKGVK